MLRKLLMLIFVCCIGLTTAQAAEDKLLLVTPKGAWEATVVNGVPGNWTKLTHNVMISGFGDIDIDVPDDPDDPDVPDTTDPLVKELVKVNKARLTDVNQAAALAATCDLLVDSLDSNKTPAEIKEAFDLSINLVGKALNSKKVIEDWQIALDSVPDWQYSLEHLKKLGASLNSAFDLDPAVAKSLAKSQIPAFADGQEVAGLNITSILAIVEAIIQLLTLLGII